MKTARSGTCRERNLRRGAVTAASEAAGPDAPSSAGAQPPVRSLQANEDRPVQSTARPPVTQIAADCLADINGQRKPLAAAALADHNQLPSTPVNVFE